MLSHYLLSSAIMDEDGVGPVANILNTSCTAAVADHATASAASAAAASAALVFRLECAKRDQIAAIPQPAGPPHQNNPAQVNPSNLITQCSTAKKIGRTVEVYGCEMSVSGPQYTAATANIPRVGSMFKSESDMNTFHRARMQNNKIPCNEVISMTFDPATMNCISCKSSHPVLGKSSPSAICFSDQNFTPNLCTTTGTGCVAVVRMEDATLSELASIAIEILEKNALQPGSVLLFGSISHLFKVGAGSYVAEWIQLLMKIETKFKNINVCPLVPVISDVTSGMVVRDLELISTWFHKVYANNIKGLLDTWAAVTHYAQQSGSGAVPSTNDEIQKIPMPANMVTPLLVPTYFKFCNSAPAILTGMSSLVTSELLRILLSALHQNFSVAVGTEVILESVAMAEGDVKVTKHLVCIGSSIVKQLIPSLQAAGYTITDLSQPGWLATEENIQLLIKKMSELQLHQPFSVVMDLFSNCSHRFENFDGTQSLPFKDGSKYHMLGPVVACNEDTFRKIIKSLAPVLLSAQSIKKILIPPYPAISSLHAATRPHIAQISYGTAIWRKPFPA
jgi:hypothetical protein